MGSVSKRRLLFGVHSLCAGGTERVVSGLLNELSGRPEFDVHCVLYGRQRQVFYELKPDITLHKPSFEFDNHSRLVSTIKTIAFLRSLVMELKPEAFFNFGERWNNLALLSSLGVPLPKFVADRSSPAVSLGRFHDALRRLLYPRAKSVIVQTSEAKTALLARYPKLKSIVVIPNPVFCRPEGGLALDSGRDKVVLFVGRLIPTKHVDRLIRIFARASDPGWRLKIVGDDAQGYSLRSDLEKLTDRLGMGQKVEFCGFQEDMRRIYENASVFAFPSSSEGFPNALAEALSFGLPAVSYNCSAGPSDLIVDWENGFLVPTFDDELFEQNLELLMKDSGLREKMSRTALVMSEALAVDKIVPRFINLVAAH